MITFNNETLVPTIGSIALTTDTVYVHIAANTKYIVIQENVLGVTTWIILGEIRDSSITKNTEITDELLIKALAVVTGQAAEVLKAQ